ncbi:Transposase protein [Popillia japonica]|uniref:Transposase protein n=1 Tax=Popillia japonica TaxID=7064 RepID=A0AAW1IBT2_POPJA
MALNPHIEYSTTLDIVEGFADDGNVRKHEIATHVMVFMIRGVFSAWRQPVAYSFCKSTTSAEDIIKTLRIIIKKATAIKFKIISCVCDQGATNVKAINMMVAESRGMPFDALRQGKTVVENVIIVDEHCDSIV